MCIVVVTYFLDCVLTIQNENFTIHNGESYAEEPLCNIKQCVNGNLTDVGKRCYCYTYKSRSFKRMVNLPMFLAHLNWIALGNDTALIYSFIKQRPNYICTTLLVSSAKLIWLVVGSETAKEHEMLLPI